MLVGRTWRTRHLRSQIARAQQRPCQRSKFSRMTSTRHPGRHNGLSRSPNTDDADHRERDCCESEINPFRCAWASFGVASSCTRTTPKRDPQDDANEVTGRFVGRPNRLALRHADRNVTITSDAMNTARSIRLATRNGLETSNRATSVPGDFGRDQCINDMVFFSKISDLGASLGAFLGAFPESAQ